MKSAARRSAVSFPTGLARAGDIQDVGSSIGVARCVREDINVVAVRPEIGATVCDRNYFTERDHASAIQGVGEHFPAMPNLKFVSVVYFS
jgi:hypothetical protein